MKHQLFNITKADSISLGDFTPMEFHCVASHDKLKSGDKVLVIYQATVGNSGTIGPLEVPLIVKTSKFQNFIDRLIQIMGAEEDDPPTPVSSEVSVSSTGENGLPVKADTSQADSSIPTPA